MSPVLINPFLGASGPPPSGANKIFWFQQNIGMFSDTAGTTPQSSNGGEVQHWADQSGNNHYAFNGAGNSPKLDTGVTYLSNPTIRLGPSGLWWGTNGTITAPSTGCDFWAVLKAVADTPTGYSTLVGATKAGRDSTYYPGGSAGGSNLEDGIGKDGSRVAFAPGVSISSQFRVYNTSAATNAKNVYLDGSNIYTSSSFTYGWDATTLPIGSDGVGDWGNFWIAEMILYDAVLNSTERAATLNYLQTGSGSPT